MKDFALQSRSRASVNGEFQCGAIIFVPLRPIFMSTLCQRGHVSLTGSLLPGVGECRPVSGSKGNEIKFLPGKSLISFSSRMRLSFGS